MLKTRFILLTFALSLCVPALSQNRNLDDAVPVEGFVYDASTSQPLIGVQVSSADIVKAVVTDSTGHFSIKVFNPDAELLFHRDGYFRRSVDLYGRSSLDVYMQDVSRTMGTDTYLTFSGSKSLDKKSGTAEGIDVEILNKGAGLLSEALAGRFTGLRVTQKSGMPGEGAVLNFRGIRTMYGDNTPLVVVDGVPLILNTGTSGVITGYSPDILEEMNISNIEKIAFIRGAEALPYGSLGSNGVLVIETQRGKVSRTAVEFRSVEGVGRVAGTIPLLSGLDFNRYIADLSVSRYANASETAAALPFLSGNMSPRDQVRFGFNTDWQNLIYQPALHSDNSLKVRGGDTIVQYLVTAGYQASRGSVIGSDRNKFYTTGNTNINFSEKLTAFASVSFDFTQHNLQEQGMIQETNPMLAAFAHSPINGVHEIDDDGGIQQTLYEQLDPVMNISNPAAIVRMVEAKNKVYDFFVNLGLDYKISQKWSADVKFGIFYNYIRDDIFIGGKDDNCIAPLANGIALNSVRSGATQAYDYFGRTAAKYTLSKSGHRVDAVGGFQILGSRRQSSRGSGINTSTDNYKNLGNVASLGRNTGGYADALNWISFFAKGDYNWRDQFFATAAMNLEASSSYGAYSGRWFVFPALNAGWKLSNSPWLRDNTSIGNLMLRAEYSINPNGRFSNAYSSYYYNLSLIRDVSGLVRAGVPNEKLGPERVHNRTVGIDYASRGDKFTLSFDLYDEHVRDMVIHSAISPAHGFNYTYKNDGEISTVGVDLAASLAVIDRTFQWRIGGNASVFASRILSLGDDREQIIRMDDGVALVNRVGFAPYSFFALKADGVFESGAAASKAGLTSTGGYQFGAGDMRFVDRDGDKVISDDDRFILGSAQPLLSGAVYSNMSWKGLKLYANFTYSAGNKIYNATRRFNEDNSKFANVAASVSRRWLLNGQVTDIPKAVYGDPADNNRFSSRWIEDGSFIKMKELTLSWETHDRFLFMNGFKVYLTGENLFCLTPYTGIDPEFAYSYDMSMMGMDMAKIPLTKFVKLGIVMNL
ncbi:MAG: SusC/RagA family TonB-linked outer membrane protein [Bacteroidales bacterium]|nr:SusC/RagA family TonB-linked outer membrane protein [Bacteroidales bacterium]